MLDLSLYVVGIWDGKWRRDFLKNDVVIGRGGKE